MWEDVCSSYADTTILQKGPEHLQVLVSAEGWILRDESMCLNVLAFYLF